MGIDQNVKIAATISAKLRGKERAIIFLTSSNEKVELDSYAMGICRAFKQSGKEVVLVNAKLGSKTSASYGEPVDNGGVKVITLKPSDNKDNTINEAFVETLYLKWGGANTMLVCCDSINHCHAALYFAAFSDGAVLIEKKKLSRTDEIEKAIDTINNMGTDTFGFVFVN